MAKDLNEARHSLHAAAGELNYHLECFGDKLAKEQRYKGVDGMEAIYLYLVKTYHWTPACVRGMSQEDIRFVLSQEMEAYVNPASKKKP